MTLRYHTRNDRQVPTYVCQREGIEDAKPICQSIPGQTIDLALGELMLELMTPLTLEVALAVQQELEQRLENIRSDLGRGLEAAVTAVLDPALADQARGSWAPTFPATSTRMATTATLTRRGASR